MALRVISGWVGLLVVFAASAQPVAAQTPSSAACEALKITGQLTPENILRYGCDRRKPAIAAPTVPGTVPGKSMAAPSPLPRKSMAPLGQARTEGRSWRVERSENGTWVWHGDFETDERAVAGAHRACVDRGRLVPIVVASRVRYQETVRHQYQCVQHKAVETRPSE